MKGKTWNDIVKPIVVLVVICLVASAALAGVNQVTAPIIAEQQEAAANEAYPHAGVGVLSAPDSKVKVLVVPTNEELSIARETLGLVKKA